MSTSVSGTVSLTIVDEEGKVMTWEHAVRTFQDQYDKIVDDAAKKQKLIALATRPSLSDETEVCEPRSVKRAKTDTDGATRTCRTMSEAVEEVCREFILDAATVKLALRKATEWGNEEFITTLTAKILQDADISASLLPDESIKEEFVRCATKAKTKSVCNCLLRCVREVMIAFYKKTDYNYAATGSYCRDISYVLSQSSEVKIAESAGVASSAVGASKGGVFTETVIDIVKKERIGAHGWVEFSKHLLINDRIEPLVEKILDPYWLQHHDNRWAVSETVSKASQLPSRRLYDRILGATAKMRKVIFWSPEDELSYDVELTNPSILASACRSAQSGKKWYCRTTQSSDAMPWTMITLYVSARDVFDKLCAAELDFEKGRAEVIRQHEEMMKLLIDLTCQDLAQLVGQYLFSLEPAEEVKSIDSAEV